MPWRRALPALLLAGCARAAAPEPLRAQHDAALPWAGAAEQGLVLGVAARTAEHATAADLATQRLFREELRMRDAAGRVFAAPLGGPDAVEAGRGDVRLALRPFAFAMAAGQAAVTGIAWFGTLSGFDPRWHVAPFAARFEVPAGRVAYVGRIGQRVVRTGGPASCPAERDGRPACLRILPLVEAAAAEDLPLLRAAWPRLDWPPAILPARMG